MYSLAPGSYWLRTRKSRATSHNDGHLEIRLDYPLVIDRKSKAEPHLAQLRYTWRQLKVGGLTNDCIRYLIRGWLSHLVCKEWSPWWHRNVCLGSTRQIFKLTFTGHYRIPALYNLYMLLFLHAYLSLCLTMFLWHQQELVYAIFKTELNSVLTFPVSSCPDVQMSRWPGRGVMMVSCLTRPPHLDTLTMCSDIGPGR